jgi:outer membrane protein assembly factor BamB
MAIAGVLLCIGVIVASVGVLQIREENSTATAHTTPAATAVTPAGPTPTSTSLPIPPGNDWMQYRYDTAGTGVNPENALNTANVAQLTNVWTAAEFGGHSFESSPTVFHGVVYVANGTSLWALDLRTGKKLWQYLLVPADKLPQISSSVAIDPNTEIAYFGMPDTRVAAVSLKTHSLVWQVTLGDPKKGGYIWSSPLLAHGLLYIGYASWFDHPCVRGSAYALDPATGKTVWVHYMVPQGRLGGDVWSSMKADPDEQAIIVTTGNPCDEAEDAPVQGGVSDYDQNAILALNWDTGKTLWRFTAVKNDFDQDLDFGQGAVIFAYHGQKWVVAGNKQGMVYAVHPVAPGQQVKLAWSLRIANQGYLATGGIYTPPTYQNGLVFVAGGPTPDGVCRQGALVAVHADTGAVAWRQCTAGQIVGAPALSGGVLFVGQHLKVVAYAATTGKVLWQGTINGNVWGGVTVSHGYLLVGTETSASRMYAFALPAQKPTP